MKTNIRKLVTAAMLMAVGIVLPFFTGQIPQVGNMLLPMPNGLAMAFELAAYGAISGFLYNRSRWQCIVSLYRSLVIAMIGGRVIWGMVRVVMLGMTGNAFTWQMFMAGAFLNAVPGIILQLVFIPALMVALNKTGIVRFYREQKATVKAGQGI